MATIVTRSGKGSPLTNTEVDSNFTNLNTDKLELSGGTMTGNLSLGDNDKAIFGAGSDLQIYHDGSHSYINEAGTGNLYIRGENVIIEDNSGNDFINGNATTGALRLYHNNAQKLSTTSTGIDVTGTVTADGLNVNGSLSSIEYSLANSNPHSHPALQLKNTNTTDGNVASLMLSADNANGVVGSAYIYVQSETTNQKGNLILAREDGANNPATSMKLSSNGDISFYEDTGTTAKLTWDSSAESLNFADNGKAIFGAGSDLQIYHNGTHSYVKDAGTGNLNLQGENLVLENTSGDNYLVGVNGSFVKLYYSGSEKLATTSTGIDVTGNIAVSGTVDGRDIATNIPASLGTAGQVLTVNSGASAGEWADAGGGSPDLYADNYDGTSTAPSATGTNAIALGYSSVASGSRSLALIQGSTASGNRSIAAGLGAIASATNSIAIGSNNATASASAAIALGHDSTASGQYAIALGKSQASTEQGFAVQINNNTTSYGASGVFGSTAIGNTAKATGSVAIALGQGSIASGSKALAFGTGATASSGNSVAIGYNTTANVTDGVAIGGSGKPVKISGAYTLPTSDGSANQVLTTNGSGVISFATAAGGATSINGLSDGFADSNSNLGLGDNSAFGNISTAYRNIALGWNTAGSITTGDDNVLLGRNVSAFLTTGTGNTAVGASALPGSNLDKMTGNYNTAVGQSAANSIRFGDSGTFIGHNSNGASNADFQTAIGYNAVTGAASATALTNSRAAGANSIAGGINQNSTSYGTSGVNSVAFGTQARATNNSSASIGQSSIASGYQSAAYGYNAVASGQDSFAGGPTTDATATNSTALGKGAQATHANATSVGYNAATSATNQVSIGASGYAVKISSAYTLPTSDGTNGQVMTTDGSGSVTFADAGGSFTLIKENYVNGTAPTVTGNDSVAIGDNASATGVDSMTFGYYAQNAGNNSVAIGYSTVEVNANQCSALGTNAKVIPASGVITNATAIGKSRASNSDTLAANISNNTTSYGALGANSIAVGSLAKANQANGIAIGKDTLVDSGVDGIALGRNARAGNNAISIGQTGWGGGQSYASGQASISIGQNNLAQQSASVVLGIHGHSNTVGKYVYSSGYLGGQGNAQTGTFILIGNTTDATAKALGTNTSTLSSTNQIVLPNNSCYGFTGTVIAREQASATNDFAVWEIKGGAVRAASASTTALGSYNINKISESTGATNWSIALSADTTNGAVAITVTGEASHNIRWVATVNTTEVTY